MNHLKNLNQQLVKEFAPLKIEDRSYQEKGHGKKDSKSKIESIRGISLCPHYSPKKLQRINTINIKKNKYGHGNNFDIYSVKMQISTRNAFNQEAILQ